MGGGKMSKVRSTRRLLVLATAVLLVLASLPAVGTHEAGHEAETLRLHLGTDGTYFRYSAGGVPVTQTIGAPTRCEITVGGPLAAIDASDRGPGLVGVSIGTKSGGSQGIPCSRVDSSEDLTISLLGVPDAVKAAFDFELKGDAKIDIVLSLGTTTVSTFQLRAGAAIVAGEGLDGSMEAPFTATATAANPIANCRNASDSGPDSGANDNCYLTVDPGASFDTVEFRPLGGEVSLEGSGDFANDANFDTIFTLAEFDGELGCDETNNSDSIEEGTVFGEITRLQNTDGSVCVLKPYNLDVDTTLDTLSFVPQDNPGEPQPAAYQAILMFSPETAANPFESNLQYDQDDKGPLGFTDVPWCAGDPFTDPDAPGSINTGVIPTGDTWCIVEATTSVDSETETRTTWIVVGIGDPKFR
jgi:hypothetical protein